MRNRSSWRVLRVIAFRNVLKIVSVYGCW